MMIQNHLIAGYMVAQLTTSQPLLGFTLALASHYLLDYICTYPSNEMEIKMQDKIESKRDKVTFSFVVSVMILLSLAFLLMIAVKGQFSTFMFLCLLLANLPDIWGQIIIPLLKRDRKKTIYSHEKVLIKDPYLSILVHQLFTLVGFAVLILTM